MTENEINHGRLDANVAIGIPIVENQVATADKYAEIRNTKKPSLRDHMENDSHQTVIKYAALIGDCSRDKTVIVSSCGLTLMIDKRAVLEIVPHWSIYSTGSLTL